MPGTHSKRVSRRLSPSGWAVGSRVACWTPARSEMALTRRVKSIRRVSARDQDGRGRFEQAYLIAQYGKSARVDPTRWVQ